MRVRGDGVSRFIGNGERVIHDRCFVANDSPRHGDKSLMLCVYLLSILLSLYGDSRSLGHTRITERA